MCAYERIRSPKIPVSNKIREYLLQMRISYSHLLWLFIKEVTVIRDFWVDSTDDTNVDNLTTKINVSLLKLGRMVMELWPIGAYHVHRSYYWLSGYYGLSWYPQTIAHTADTYYNRIKRREPFSDLHFVCNNHFLVEGRCNIIFWGRWTEKKKSAIQIIDTSFFLVSLFGFTPTPVSRNVSQ